jgi:hypothetical protein
MQTIITEFENFMGKYGQYYHEFYVGIARDPSDRLVSGHGVTTDVPNVYWTAPLHTQIVRAIEKHFLDKGTKGGPGGGDSNTCYIYAYKISPNTRE